MLSVLIVVGILFGALTLVGAAMLIFDMRYYRKKEKEKHYTDELNKDVDNGGSK